MERSMKSFKKNWIIIFTGLIYSIINIMMIIILSTFFKGVLFILTGFIMAIVSSSLISNYLYLLFNIINQDNITMDNFKEGFKYFLWKIYGIFFIAWIGNYLFSILTTNIRIDSISLARMISIIILVALNPLPETIYQKYYSPFESIQYAFEFMKENCFNWILPNALLYFLLYLVTNSLLTNIFGIYLTFSLNFSVKSILSYFLGQALFSFTMIYRGHLFKILSTSTRRKRMYMDRFYK